MAAVASKLSAACTGWSHRLLIGTGTVVASGLLVHLPSRLPFIWARSCCLLPSAGRAEMQADLKFRSADTIIASGVESRLSNLDCRQVG